jgi:carboxylesterase type B
LTIDNFFAGLRPEAPNRLRAPKPVEPWKGVRNASEFGPKSPQATYPPGIAEALAELVGSGKDCLTLNVWTPNVGAAGRPVMVWIPGGMFEFHATGASAFYDGGRFARDGVVCVTIGYRVGAESFLYLGDGLANLGLLDSQKLSELPADALRRGIEGDVRGVPALDDATREAIAATAPEQVLQAQARLREELIRRPDPEFWGEVALSSLPWAPTVDGEILPKPPIDAIRAGAGADTELLVGSNTEETRLFADHPARKAGQDRREGRQPRALRHVPYGRGRGVATDLPRNLYADRAGADAARAKSRALPAYIRLLFVNTYSLVSYSATIDFSRSYFLPALGTLSREPNGRPAPSRYPPLPIIRQ